MESSARKAPGICVFSGGTAANFLVDVFNQLSDKRRCPLTYIIPISDNGGSSSELIRVFGGPSVGDVRSRLVRLIPNTNGEDEEKTAVKALFEHRLSSDPIKARTDWLDIVEARHLLWTFISSPKRELIRSVLNTLNMEIVKRARPTSVFNFAEASIGNLFLTGARLFSGSFESAIYLLSLLCSIPEHVSVLPSINSNFTHHISAQLADGTTIAGQVNISHPSAPTSLPDNLVPPETHPRRAELLLEAHDRIEDANLPGSLPALRRQHIAFSKADEEDLSARIERVWYINPYGHEIWPLANPKVISALQDARAVVYSIGSLYTSIIPSLILRGVGSVLGSGTGTGTDGTSAAAGSQQQLLLRFKVLILNSKVDRETGPARQPMTAVDFVRAIARAAKESQVDFGPVSPADCGRYVTHLVYLGGAGGVDVDGDESSGSGSSPVVDEEALMGLGIRCVKVKGRLEGSSGRGRILRYDEGELAAALDAILDS